MSRQRPLSAVAKTRNSFRPFFKSRAKRSFWKEMQFVRQQTLATDYANICTVIESNAAYPFPGLGNTFPREPDEVPNRNFSQLKVLDLARELALQVARVNHHAETLLPALASLACINEHMARHELEEAETAIAAHKQAHGLSLVVLKKELLLAVERHGLPGLSKKYKALTTGYENTVWGVLCHYLYDLVDPTHGPARASPNWLSLAEARMEKTDRSQWYARLLQDEVLTRSRTDGSLAAVLLRYSALSLLDLCLLLWRKAAVHPKDQRLQKGFQQLDSKLRAVLSTSFSEIELLISSAFRLSERPPSDIPEAAKALCARFEVEVKACLLYEFDNDAWRVPLRDCLNEISVRNLKGDS